MCVYMYLNTIICGTEGILSQRLMYIQLSSNFPATCSQIMGLQVRRHAVFRIEVFTWVIAF